MREIKFRAWSAETGKMLVWEELLGIGYETAESLK